MLFHFRSRAIIYAVTLSLTFLCATIAHAQTDAAFGDAADDPVKIFYRAQDAHAANRLELALELYERAILLRPEFPEAEYQRGTALVALGRLPEAEKAFRRAIELRADWSLPPAALGALLVHLQRFDDAAQFLERAIKLDATNSVALVALADLRLQTHLQTKASREALQSLLMNLRRATSSEQATASLWTAQAAIERALDDKAAAMTSLDHALGLDAKNVAALTERAELFAALGDYEHAIESALAAQKNSASRASAILFLANIYARAGKKDDALRTLDSLDEAARKSPEAIALRNALTVVATETPDRAALETRLAREPRNAALLAQVAELYRTDDPTRAAEYYRRALEIEPRNADYATGLGGALVQLRRFETAAALLRSVVAAAPNNFTAHANLATALYELKRFSEALIEYNWLLQKKSDLTIAYYFIATAHDYLMQYPEALAAYESFLARADAQANRLEIEKVNLRLPTLRRQIQRKEGIKRPKQVH